MLEIKRSQKLSREEKVRNACQHGEEKLRSANITEAMEMY